MINTGNINRSNINHINGQSQHQNGGRTKNNINGNNSNNNGNIHNGGNNNNIKKSQQLKSVNNMNNVVDISDDSPTERQTATTNSSNRIQITHSQQGGDSNNVLNSNNNLSSDPYEVPNLSLRQVCLCGKSCQMMQPKKDFVFKCCHCNLNYHVECMQRGKNNINQTDPIKKLVSCAYCHLKDLVPMK